MKFEKTLITTNNNLYDISVKMEIDEDESIKIKIVHRELLPNNSFRHNIIVSYYLYAIKRYMSNCIRLNDVEIYGGLNLKLTKTENYNIDTADEKSITELNYIFDKKLPKISIDKLADNISSILKPLENIITNSKLSVDSIIDDTINPNKFKY